MRTFDVLTVEVCAAASCSSGLFKSTNTSIGSHHACLNSSVGEGILRLSGKWWRCRRQLWRRFACKPQHIRWISWFHDSHLLVTDVWAPRLGLPLLALPLLALPLLLTSSFLSIFPCRCQYFSCIEVGHAKSFKNSLKQVSERQVCCWKRLNFHYS